MSTFSAYILSLSPSGYWRLGDLGSGTAIDSSGNGRNGTYHGSYSQGQPGAILGDANASVYFTGGYISVPHDSTLNNTGKFSLMYYYKELAADSPAGGVMGTGSPTGGGYTVGGIGTTSPGWEFTINTAAGAAVASWDTAHYAGGVWHQVFWVYDPATPVIYAYIDGVLTDTVPPFDFAGTYSGGSHDLWIGTFDGNSDTGHVFLGEVAYWSGVAVTAGQISSAYAAGPPSTGTGYPVAKISGSTVNVEANTLDVNQQIGQRGTGSVTVWSGLGVRWSYGTAISIVDGNGATVFNGYVAKDKATKQSHDGTGYLEHALTLMDNAYRADKRLITESYLNETADAIFNNLVSKYLAAEGVTTASSVAAGVLVPAKAWVLEKCSAAFDWLAEQCGFWWSIDSAGVAWFQPYTGRASGVSIDGSTLSADDVLSVTFGNDQLVTKQYVKGANAETPQRTEYFTGDGTRQSFTLAYEVSSGLSILLDGVGQSLGTKAVDSGKQWYYAVGDAVIAQDQSGTPIGPGDTLAVTYKGRYPIIAAAYNPTLIANQATLEGGGSGLVESVITDTKLYNQDAALAVAQAALAKNGSDLTLMEWQTKTNPGLIPGQSFTATLTDWGITSHTFLVIYAGQLDAPGGGVTIWYHLQAVGSPFEPAQHQAFWRKLMSQAPNPDVIAANVVTVAVVSNALEADSTLAVSARVVMPSGNAGKLIANSTLKGP